MTQSDHLRDDEIDVRVEGTDWPPCIEGVRPTALVRIAVVATLEKSGPDGAVEVSVLLTGAEAVRHLNRRYRGRDMPTNVLAFAVQDDDTDSVSLSISPMPIGDIVIAGSVCREEAAAQGKSLADHVRHLAVHGTLHLLGYDHEAVDEAECMEGLERDILATLGVSDPYGASAVA